MKEPSEGHQADEGEGWDLNPDLPDLRPAFSSLAGSVVQRRPGRPDWMAPAFLSPGALALQTTEEVFLR